MHGLRMKMAAITVLVTCITWSVGAAELSGADDALPITPGSRFLLGPPEQAGPIVVRAAFKLRDLNEINDVTETFEFSGVLTLTWRDPRRAFDPVVVGANEKVFQGNYQFNEVSTGWYPQVVLMNEAGTYQNSGVVLRIQPDGTSTLIETISAVAENELDMRWFPFDTHRLQIVFEVLGFDRDEVVLQGDPSIAGPRLRDGISIPQWKIARSDTAVEERSASYAGRLGIASTFVVSLDVERDSFYIRRLITLPLIVIVLLSFSVFWMDRSSLGDRISVSFIGILTGVAYQLMLSDVLPRISYVTVMHGFMTVSFLTMSATVVINLVVGALDKQARHQAGDLIDRRCRWIFPLVYFALNFTILAAAFVLFPS
jgi:hypothetical protein